MVHLTMSPIPDLDPTRARNNENLAQYDALMEWESTWWFPEVHTTPTIRPNIAISWEAVDPQTWDFKINPNARFHDIAPMNGRAVTAEDIKYSFELLSVVPQYTATASVESVEVIDTETVRFNLHLPLANFPPLYTNGSTPPVVAKEAQESEGGLHENPGGTGAFLLKEFAAGEGMLFEATDDYHLELMASRCRSSTRCGMSSPAILRLRLLSTVRNRSTCCVSAPLTCWNRSWIRFRKRSFIAFPPLAGATTVSS